MGSAAKAPTASTAPSGSAGCSGWSPQSPCRAVVELRGLGCCWTRPCKPHPPARVGASLSELSHCWDLPHTLKSYRKQPQQWLALSQLHAGDLASRAPSWPRPSTEG